MRTFVISDTHFGHRMLDQFRGENFEKKIINEWNKAVDPIDTVIHLGDFALGKYKEGVSLRDSIKMWRDKLNGSIVLVKGNHDGNITIGNNNGCFQFICDSFVLKTHGKKILFSHKPIDFGDWELDFDLNIHGHIHSEMRIKELEGIEYDEDKQRCMAVDFTGFKPVLLETVIKEML